MAETNVAEVPAVTIAAPTVDTVKVAATPEPDLMTRVTQFSKTQNKPQDNIQNAPEQPEFESIQDPVAKEAAKQAVERMRRGMQSEYTRKLEDLNKNVPERMQNWSPERIQRELLNDPQFLQAAQQIAQGSNANPVNSGLTEEQYSALTDSEKQKLASIPMLQNEINTLKQNNAQSAIRSQIAATDAQLQTKYTDYNPVQINEAIEKLGSLSMADIREWVYKAQFHDDHVKSSYEMAKQEKLGLIQEKINAITPSGTNTVNNDGVPTKNAKETDQAFFVRLGQFRLEQSRKR